MSALAMQHIGLQTTVQRQLIHRMILFDLQKARRPPMQTDFSHHNTAFHNNGIDLHYFAALSDSRLPTPNLKLPFFNTLIFKP